MKDSFILKAAVLTAIIGIGVLFLVMITAELPSSIIMSEIDSEVRISGLVNSVKNYGQITIVTLDFKDRVDVVLFEDINLTGQLEVVGKVDVYNGKRQLVAEKVKVLG